MQPRSFLPFSFYYGWVIVIASALALTLAWSVRVTFTAFYAAMIEDLGWSSSGGALGYSLSWLLLLVFSPVGGYLFDRFGPRFVAPLGAASLVVGLALLSTVHALWVYILYFGVLVGFGEALLITCSAASIPRWFSERQGRAQGVVATGYAIGPIVLLPLTQHFISAIGWRESFLILAGIIGAFIPLAMALYRNRPEPYGQVSNTTAYETTSEVNKSSSQAGDPTLGSALRSVSFWALAVSFFFGVVSYNILLVHQMARATDAGVEKDLSASIFGMAGLFTFAGVVAGGALSDKIGREWVFTLGSLFALSGLAIFSSLSGPGEVWKLVVYAVAAGLGFGFRLPLLAVIPSDIFKGEHFGRILGVLHSGSALGGFVGPYLAGFLFDALESYSLAFAVAAGAVALSGSLVWVAAPGKRRRMRQQALVIAQSKT